MNSLIIEVKMYLLQINRIKLQDYIQRGLIVPDKYLYENKEIDTQSKNPNFLVSEVILASQI